MSHVRSRYRGSLAVELAIALPLFLAMVFASVSFGIAMMVNAVVDESVQGALAKAVVDPSFNTQPSGLTSMEDCDDGQFSATPFCESVAAIKQSVIDLTSTAWVSTDENSGSFGYFVGGPKVDIPIAKDSIEQAYATRPFTVSATVRLNLFGIYPIDLGAVATGYYEVHHTPTMPAAMDCNGYPYMHPLYQSEQCDCSYLSNATTSLVTHQCHICEYDRKAPLPGGGAPSGYGDLADDHGCYCPTSSTCEAIYGTGSVRYTAGPDKCKCGCYANNGWDGGLMHTCQCSAPPASYTGASGQVVTFDPSRVEQGGICYCSISEGSEVGTPGKPISAADCDQLFPDAAGRLMPSPTGCGCWCQTTNFDQGICAGTGGKIGYGQAPDGNGNRNNPTCECSTCPSGKTYDAPNNICVCNGGCEIGHDEECCGTGNTYDQSNCECQCQGDCNGYPNAMRADCTCDCDNPGGNQYTCTPPDNGGGGG